MPIEVGEGGIEELPHQGLGEVAVRLLDQQQIAVLPDIAQISELVLVIVLALGLGLADRDLDVVAPGALAGGLDADILLGSTSWRQRQDSRGGCVGDCLVGGRGQVGVLGRRGSGFQCSRGSDRLRVGIGNGSGRLGE